MNKVDQDANNMNITDLPQGWKVTKIKYIAQLAPRCNTNHLSEDSLVTFAPMECIKKGFFINRSAAYKHNNSSYNGFEEGDIVIAKVTPCFENGNIAIMQNLFSGYGFGSSELFVLRSKDAIVKKYLFYYLQNPHFINWGVSTMTGTGGLKRVSSDFMKNSLILVPPINEQNRIVSYLDSKISMIDSLIERTKQTISDYKALMQSIINEAVTKGLKSSMGMMESNLMGVGLMPQKWKITSLKRVAYIRYGLGQPPAPSLDGLPIIRATNVDAGKIIEENMIYAKLEDIQTAKDVLLSEGDIIIVRSGAYTGDVGYIDETWAGSLAGYDMIVSVRHDNSKFILYTLLSAYVLENQIMLMRMRAAQPHLNAEEVGSLKIVIPPLEEQDEIVRYLDTECATIDGLIRQKQKLVEEMEAYKKSLIYECVTGKREVI